MRINTDLIIKINKNQKKKNPEAKAIGMMDELCTPVKLGGYFYINIKSNTKRSISH